MFDLKKLGALSKDEKIHVLTSIFRMEDLNEDVLKKIDDGKGFVFTNAMLPIIGNLYLEEAQLKRGTKKQREEDIQREDANIIYNILKSIPDSNISIVDKMKFITKNFKGILPKESDVAYRLPVGEENILKFQDKVKKMQKIVIKDKVADYAMAMLETVEPNDGMDILRISLKSVPDSEVSVHEKFLFMKNNFKKIQDEFSDLSYDESLPSLKDQKLKTKISLKEYLNAMKEGVNYSDYIVQSLGLLENAVGKDDINSKNLLSQIKKNYLELNYEKCITDLVKLSEELRKNDDKKEIGDAIIYASKLCTEVVFEKNDTRRYFETKLSQYMLGDAESKEVFNSINKISKFFGRSITKESEIEDTIALVAEYNPESVKEYNALNARHEQLKDMSPKYGIKDRILKPGFLSREDESLDGLEGSASSSSMNLGVMRANAPNFRDEIAKLPLRNRIVDVTLPDKEIAGYSTKDKRGRSAFVSSISGHTFYTVAVLELYMKRNKGPNLNKDINNFLNAYVAIYAKRGYHSAHEVLDVLRESHIVALFKKYGVTLNFTVPQSTLDKAMNDTLAYSKGTTIKSALHNELKESFSKGGTKPSDIAAYQKVKSAILKNLEEKKAPREVIDLVTKHIAKSQDIQAVKILQNKLANEKTVSLLIDLQKYIERKRTGSKLDRIRSWRNISTSKEKVAIAKNLQERVLGGKPENIPRGKLSKKSKLREFEVQVSRLEKAKPMELSSQSLKERAGVAAHELKTIQERKEHEEAPSPESSKVLTLSDRKSSKNKLTSVEAKPKPDTHPKKQ